jgi:hypothetical protein
MPTRFCLATLLLVLPLITPALHAQQDTWSFAVSGDSRNCGDIVMPAIAAGVNRDRATFYWHLGDYRAIYMVDEDYLKIHPKTTIIDYETNAWPDFIQHQLAPFGDLPVFLGKGNHETIPPKTQLDYLTQFTDWLDAPTLKKQRLADDPTDHQVKNYYHWIDRGIDFISLDNSLSDQFDSAQLAWLLKVLQRDETNDAVRSLVLGMHAALPDSLSAGHSMNDSAQETASGRQAYAALLDFRNKAHKNVYVLASHSHFVMNNIYADACHPGADALPGWIIGTAGAVRYRLPPNLGNAKTVMTDVYGYLLGTVAADGTVQFEFKQVKQSDVPEATVNEFTADQVKWCFEQNKSAYVVGSPTCPVPRPRQ